MKTYTEAPMLPLLLLSGCISKKITSVEKAAPEELRPPAPEEFQLGKGDKIAIRVWRHDDLDMDVTIAPDGSISYPLVGQLRVEGMTYNELVQSLREAIQVYYKDPQVSVNVLELSNQKIFVLGPGVNHPSVLQLQSEMSVLEAITRSGGISTTAKTKNILLIRGGLETPKLYKINVHAMTKKGDLNQMVYLQRGDIVMVPMRTISSAAMYFRDIQSFLAPVVAGTVIYRNTATTNRTPVGASSALGQ